MSSTSCHHCGCSEIDRDPARGDAVCTGCGSVLEDNIIVSEVQFEETTGGGSSAVGQFVSSEGKAALSIAFHHGMGKESRAITLQNGRKKIVQLAQQLRLNQHCVDTAFNFFKMAVAKKQTRGRKHSHVIAACVYMVCRTEGTAHMLLDLSDIVQVNVYILGKTFLHLSQALCINIPPIDPCLYIIRFAHRLEFADKTHDVSMTALRLVQRMKRDWMHTGRRPSGLCGAALLVAARLHDFSRTTKDIIRVVKVCEATLKKRLMEFGDTPSSHLTLDQFMSIDLEEEQDPPAFKSARKKAKLQQFEDQDDTEEVTKQISLLQSQIEKALEERRSKLRGSYAVFSKETSVLEDSNENGVDTCIQDDTNDVNDAIAEQTIEAIREYLGRGSRETTEAQDDERTSEIDSINETDSNSFRGLGPTSSSLGLKESIEECMKINPVKNTEEETGELDLSGIDDNELNYYIMSDLEVERKTNLWNRVNAEYLQEQKEKEEKEAKEKEEGLVKPEKKKRKTTRRKVATPANSAGEAIEKMLQEKRISNKINYEVLRNLNNTIASKMDVSSGKHETKGNDIFTNNDNETFHNHFNDYSKSISEEMKMKLSSGTGQQEMAQSPVEKSAAVILSNFKPHSTESLGSETILETEPIQYEDNDTDEESDEDDGHISAAKLFGQSNEDGFEDYDDYDDS